MGGPRSGTRLQAAGAIALVALSAGLFAARCALDPAIPFVVQDDEAPWVMFPLPPTGLVTVAERDALPVTSFVRSVEVPAEGAPRARLRVRAMRDFELRVNGRVLPPAAGSGPAAHWRKFRSFDLSGALHAGTNELRVDVTDAIGPALLSLRLEGTHRAVTSADGWRVALAGGPWKPAVAVGSARRNPSAFALPSTFEGLAKRCGTLSALFAFSLLLHAGARTQAGRRRLPRFAVWLPALAAAAWLALFATNWVGIPLRVGFDAHHHLDYVDFLRERRTLPLATDGWSMFHPPLYYASTAALVELQAALAPASRSLVAWKLVGFLSGLSVVLLCCALARRLFPGGARELLFAAVFAAALPMNLALAAYPTNESLHAALATGGVLATVSLLLAPRPGRAALAGWALLFGLALLTKYTAAIVAAVALFFLAARWALVEQAPARGVAARTAGLALALAAIAGWFYARNWLHFHSLFPLNVDLPGQTKQWWSPPGYYTPAFFLRFGEVLGHPFLAGASTAWDSLYATLWGDGLLAGQVAAAARHRFWDYELMAAGYLLALPATLLLASGALECLRLAFRDPDPGRRAVFSFLLTLCWALFGSVLYMTLRQQDYGQPKAFYALAAAAPLCVFFTQGAAALDRRLAAHAPWARALLDGWLGCFAGVLLLSFAG